MRQAILNSARVSAVVGTSLYACLQRITVVKINKIDILIQTFHLHICNLQCKVTNLFAKNVIHFSVKIWPLQQAVGPPGVYDMIDSAILCDARALQSELAAETITISIFHLVAPLEIG